MRLKLFALMALSSLCCAAFVPALAQDAPKTEPKAAETKPDALDESKLEAGAKANIRVLDAMLDTIRQGFYDRKYGGHDLKEMRARFVKRVAESKPGEPLYKVLRELLGEFKVSHLTILAQDVYDVNFAPEMNGGRTERPGLDVTELEEGRLFISGVLDGSGAEKAGVLRGDRLVEINGKPAAQSPLLADAGGDPGLPGHPHYFVRVPEAGDLVLKVQRHAEDRDLTTLTITCTATSMIDATRKSVKVIEHEGRKFGYIHFWHFLHDGMTQALKKALTNEFKDCDGLIIDLRGRGGSPQVMNDCFSPFADPPSMGRFPGMGAGAVMPKWTRPVVALQDAGSRSAKEVYAHNWKWKKVGPLVGESTPGAVLGSTFAALPDGSQLLYPAQNVRSLTFGQVELEGNPVEPTHPVKDLLPFAAGSDTIKEAGIKILYDLVKDKPKVEPAPDPDAGEKEEGFSIQPGQWRKAG